MAHNGRKLVALDAEDLKILSAYCQDAVLRVGNISYLHGEQKLVLQMNRYIWENSDEQNERRQSVLHFERVKKVSSTGLNPNTQKDKVLNLLAITFELSDEPSGNIDLVFSGETIIRANVECIEAQLMDLEGSWAASSKPRHPKN